MRQNNLKKKLICFVSCLLALQGIASAAPTPESKELAAKVKLADVHMHTVKGLDANWLLDRMNRNGVQWGGAVGGLISEDPLKFKDALGERYIAALGQGEFTEVLATKGEKALLDPAEPLFIKLFEAAEKAFEQGKAKGFGEIHVSNKGAFGAPTNFQREISVLTPVISRMFELAEKHKGFIQIHATKLANLRELDQVAKKFPSVTLVISHCLPGAEASDLRMLFSQNPNVVCEISGAGPFHKNQRIYTSRGPKGDWLRVVEEFPDRFMVGSDAFLGVHMSYDQIIKEIRESFLAHLKPETIEKVAYQNAVRIFGLKE